MESLPHDVVERIMERLPARSLLKYKCVSKQWKATLESRFFQEKHAQELIMERLPVKSLVRFKSVSKQWKYTIESRLFQERHLAHRQQSGDPDILMVSANPVDDIDSNREYLTTLELRSSAIKIPTPWTDIVYTVSSSSIDGLVCLYNPLTTGFVVNPTTRWFRHIPLSGLQQLIIDSGDAYFELGHESLILAFGKDKFTGTYKLVWLYNSSEIGLENATTCEVFDFSTNAWRYVTPSAPCRILNCSAPVFVDGSLHWFTDEGDRKSNILSFDLHTETFQVMPQTPLLLVGRPHKNRMVLCNLDNRLCISRMLDDYQSVWSFNPDIKHTDKWELISVIDLDQTRMTYEIPTTYALMPLAVLNDSPLPLLDKEGKEKRLLFYDRNDRRDLVIGKLKGETFFDRVLYRCGKTVGFPVCYFPNLITI